LRVLKNLEQHTLLDGFRIVIDLESRGSSYDAASGRRLIDLRIFRSMPVDSIIHASMIPM
jgi:hypothetical protein